MSVNRRIEQKNGSFQKWKLRLVRYLLLRRIDVERRAASEIVYQEPEPGRTPISEQENRRATCAI